MTTTTTTASPWPARAAYFSAAIFTAASGGTNLIYGWSKGSDLGSSLIWAAVSLAVSGAFTLAWPAFIKSIDARQWARAVLVLVGLLLTGTYSVVAALGSAAGGRASATAAERAILDTRAKAQVAWDAARTELDVLAATKPTTELQALIDSAKAELVRLSAARPAAEVQALIATGARNPRPGSGCTAINGSLAASCPKLEAEKARAEQREKLTAKIAGWNAEVAQAGERLTDQRDKLKAAMATAAGELAKTGPARVANADAVALAGYLSGLGLTGADAERLNGWLVLLTVLCVEMGSGLSLAIAMALSGPASGTNAQTERLQRPAAAAPATASEPSRTLAPAKLSEPPRTVLPGHVRPVGADILRSLKATGGKAEGLRQLAASLGRPRSTVADECHRLLAGGRIAMTRGRHGTVLALV